MKILSRRTGPTDVLSRILNENLLASAIDNRRCFVDVLPDKTAKSVSNACGSSRPGDDVPRVHYLRFPIRDAKGIIGLIGTVLGERGISIRHAQAELDNASESGNVYLLVDKCSPGIIRAAVGELAGLPTVRGRPVVMPLIE